MIWALLLACSDGEPQDSGASALQEPPPRWTSADLTCLNSQVSLEAGSAGQAASAVWLGGELSYPLSLIDSDGAGSWQRWQLQFSLGEEAFCAELPAWRVELRDSDDGLLDCWDAQGQPC